MKQHLKERKNMIMSATKNNQEKESFRPQSELEETKKDIQSSSNLTSSKREVSEKINPFNDSYAFEFHSNVKSNSSNSNDSHKNKKVTKIPPNRRDSRKIFVGGLPPGVDDKEFKDFFEKFGNTLDSVVIVDKVTRRSRGFGFVTFHDPMVARMVLDCGNDGKEVPPGGYTSGKVFIRGKMCEVKVSEPMKESQESPAFSAQSDKGNKSYQEHSSSSNFHYQGKHNNVSVSPVHTVLDSGTHYYYNYPAMPLNYPPIPTDKMHQHMYTAPYYHIPHEGLTNRMAFHGAMQQTPYPAISSMMYGNDPFYPPQMPYYHAHSNEHVQYSHGVCPSIVDESAAQSNSNET